MSPPLYFLPACQLGHQIRTRPAAARSAPTPPETSRAKIGCAPARGLAFAHPPCISGAEKNKYKYPNQFRARPKTTAAFFNGVRRTPSGRGSPQPVYAPLSESGFHTVIMSVKNIIVPSSQSCFCLREIPGCQKHGELLKKPVSGRWPKKARAMIAQGWRSCSGPCPDLWENQAGAS